MDGWMERWIQGRYEYAERTEQKRKESLSTELFFLSRLNRRTNIHCLE